MSRQIRRPVPRSAEAIRKPKGLFSKWKKRDIRILKVQCVIIFGLLVIVGVAGEVNYGWEKYPRGEPGGGTVAWRVSVAGDNYIIEIIDIRSEDLDDVSFAVLNTERLVTSWDDPYGDTLRIEGDLIDVNFSQVEYNAADDVADNKFYSQDPVGDPPVSINQTLCVVYMDTGSDGKLSSGDVIWIRSTANDGCAEEDYRFRMVNQKVGDAYGELVLPAV